MDWKMGLFIFGIGMLIGHIITFERLKQLGRLKPKCRKDNKTEGERK